VTLNELVQVLIGLGLSLAAIFIFFEILGLWAAILLSTIH